MRINAGREKLVSGSANVTRCGPKDNQFFRTCDMEPAETIIGLGVRERQERRQLLHRSLVGLDLISDSLPACRVIGKVYNIRNLELVPIPVRYSECVLTDLDWIEIWLLYPAVPVISSRENPRDATVIGSNPVAPEGSTRSKYV